MNITKPLDRFWGQVKDRYPNLALFDKVIDQSHIHHTLNVGIGFGLLSLAAVPFGIQPDRAVAIGWIAGVIFYLIRETVARDFQWWKDSARGRWDGIMDILVPAAMVVPHSVHVLTGVWWSPLLQIALFGACAFGWTFGRPAGALRYERLGDGVL